MHRLTIEYTDYTKRDIGVVGGKFNDAGMLEIQHIDLSTEFINKNAIRQVRIWQQLDIEKIGTDNKQGDKLENSCCGR